MNILNEVMPSRTMAAMSSSAALPWALACPVSRPARIELPFDWIAKSTMVVVPPWAAATVPVSKSSDDMVPPNGRSMWVWQSMPPGMTYWPVASMVRSAVCPPRCDGSVSPTILSPSIQTSAAKVSDAVTTVPFLMSVRMSVLDQGAVRVGAAIAEELPRPADLLDHVEIERGDDQLVLVLAAAREDLAARVDEVRAAVEPADVPRTLGADAIDRADEVAIGDGVRGLLELPQVLREPGDGGRRVVDLSL